MHSILFLLQSELLHAPVLIPAVQLRYLGHTPAKVQLLEAPNCNFGTPQCLLGDRTTVFWSFHPDAVVWGGYIWQRHRWKRKSIGGGLPEAGSGHVVSAGSWSPDQRCEALDAWQPGWRSILSFIGKLHLAIPRQLDFWKVNQPEGTLVPSRLKISYRWWIWQPKRSYLMPLLEPCRWQVQCTVGPLCFWREKCSIITPGDTSLALAE